MNNKIYLNENCLVSKECIVYRQAIVIPAEKDMRIVVRPAFPKTFSRFSPSREEGYQFQVEMLKGDQLLFRAGAWVYSTAEADRIQQQTAAAGLLEF